jgi:uncharacterized protein (TIGR00252 family)
VNKSTHSNKTEARLKLARAGEDYARRLLERSGWRIVTTNWRAGRFAEIDIIARDPDNTLVFLEVKTRKTPIFQLGFVNSGFDSIDRRKKEKIMIAASLYMTKNHCLNNACRFDAMIVYYPVNERFGILQDLPQPEVNHVVGIF